MKYIILVFILLAGLNETFGCDFSEHDFRRADLRNANFEGANLKDANFRKANLVGASFAFAYWSDEHNAILSDEAQVIRDETNKQRTFILWVLGIQGSAVIILAFVMLVLRPWVRNRTIQLKQDLQDEEN